MSVYMNYDGYRAARSAIDNGKVDEGPFELTDEDRKKMLGPKGTDLRELSRHHLGLDDSEPWASDAQHKYPFGKEGRTYTQALHQIRNKAAENGHEDIKDAASGLLGHFKVKHHPDERALETEEETERAKVPKPGEIDPRRIKHESDGWHVYSESGKHMGGPYTLKEAKARLSEIEYFKKKDKNSLETASELRFSPFEKRILPFDSAELRIEKGPNGERKLVGYAAKFDKLSQDLGGFREKIDKRAFDKVLKTADVRVLRNHDPDKLLARTKSGTARLFVDDTGLGYEANARNTQLWRDTLDDVESKDMDGSSFSFNTEEEGGDSWDRNTSPPTRTLLNIRDLFDVGPVTMPAYLDATVHARNCRSFQRLIADPEAIERAEKEAAKQRRLRLLEFKLGVKPGSLRD
jgi:uncharacterized protein